MKSSLVLGIASRLMSCPAAPYHEEFAQAEAERICAENGIALKKDAYGNLIAAAGSARFGRPIVFAAHLDHPAFEFARRIDRRRWRARFLGGVPDSYFVKGVRLRAFPRNVPAVLGKRIGREKIFEVSVEGEVRPEFAVWDLPGFRFRNGRITGRACDDLIGASAVLAALIELKRAKARCHAIGLLSRAEEVGFQGALMAGKHGAIPRKALVISLETSREMPPVKMGQGVILRVGDRASVFDSAATRFLSEVASGIQKKEPGFQFQRALMSGGTCEGTAFQEMGFQTGALCVALGNYHNCEAKNRIAAEYVSLADAEGMARLLVEAASEMGRFDHHTGKLPARLKKLTKEAERRLKGVGGRR